MFIQAQLGIQTMRLSFLGKQYEASFPAVATSETQETGTFLGQQYAKKQFSIAARQQSHDALTYRGVSYHR